MNSRIMKLFFVATVCMLISASSGYKFTSIEDQRDALADDEFSFSFMKDGVLRNNSGIQIHSLSAPRHRLLGMSDVNVGINHVVQQPGHVIPWHVHPRGSENYATISGKLQVSMTLEGLIRPRHIVSKLPPAHVFSIPQAMPHSVTCISKKPCVYHIFFNVADSGLAFTGPLRTPMRN